MMVAMRIVSIGDSFTEGMVDKDTGGALLGWADRVAMGLAAARPGEEVWFANLAVRGRLIEAIANGQLDAALALTPPPTHLTFNGGGNDMLRPGYSDDRMRALLTRVLDACAAAGVHLIILSGPDPSERLPAGRRMRELGTRLTEMVDALADGRAGVTFVDNFRDPECRRAPYWSADRLHLNSLGHERVAARVLTAMGVPTSTPVVAADDMSGGEDGPLRRSRVAAPFRVVSRALGEVGYWLVYVLPWLARRLLGKSAGDRRQPKFPAWVLVPANGGPPGA
jgi:lysophospholipase L1-like esterase